MPVIYLTIILNNLLNIFWVFAKYKYMSWLGTHRI